MTKVSSTFHAGRMLRAAREYCGVSQYDLANRLGITQPRVAQMEQRPRCASNNLAAVADALGLELGLRKRR